MPPLELPARESQLFFFTLRTWHLLHNSICCYKEYYSAVGGTPPVQDSQILCFAVPHFSVQMFSSLIWSFCGVTVNIHLSSQPANQPGLCSVSSLWVPASSWDSLSRSMVATLYMYSPWKDVALESDSGHPGAMFWISPSVFIQCKVTTFLHNPHRQVARTCGMTQVSA